MMTTCIHCKQECRLTNGKEIYPHRPDLYNKRIWKCDPCNATVGCHPGGTNALGFAANKQTRDARMKLHNLRLDPIWKNAESGKKQVRSCVYRYLSHMMGLPPEDTHTGMFTIEQCREAWTILKDQNAWSITEWCAAQDDKEVA